MTGWRWVAPAGAPIGAADALRWLHAAGSDADPEATLKGIIQTRFDVRHAYLATTGRAGLTLLLGALRRLAPNRGDEVVVPAYTCYSVAASIIKAGLRPRLVDISPETLDYCPAGLAAADYRRTLAILATNLYGLPNDLSALNAIARAHDMFLIDDAAQAMGASVDGRWSGTWGDAGLFSFDKGKNVSAIDGGVVVTQSDAVAEALDESWRRLPAASLRHSTAAAVKALGYAALLRPSLYGVPARIPQLGLGVTVYADDFPLERPSRALTTLAVTMMASLERFTEARIETAGHLAAALAGLPVTTIQPQARARAVYLRFPLLIGDATRRDRMLTTLKTLGATGSYPASLADVPEIARWLANPAAAVGGRHVARHLVTLPTHPYVCDRDVATMAAGVRAVLAAPSSSAKSWAVA